MGMGPISPGTGPVSKDMEFVTKSGGTPGSVLLTDQNKIIVLDNGASDVVLTVEEDSVTDLPIGSYFYAIQIGTGQATIARGGSVAFDTILGDVNFKIDKLVASAGAKGNLIWAIKKSANLWWIFGPIKPA